MVTSKDKFDISVDFLDEYAIRSWESVLHYLVGTQSQQKSEAVINLLLRLGLLQSASGTQDLKITNKGFQFLLQDVKVQIWAFLEQYLAMSAVLVKIN